MFELVAVLLMIVLITGAYFWREEAKYQTTLAKSNAAKLELCEMECALLRNKNNRCEHDFMISADFSDLGIDPVFVCTKCFRIKKEPEDV